MNKKTKEKEDFFAREYQYNSIATEKRKNKE
jgi:hypothetical protein